MADRATIDVATPPGGWPDPWPNVAELASVLPADRWTLVGGMMTQLHSVHRGLGVVRVTNDVDVVIHIETARGTPNRVAGTLEGLGYRLVRTADPRDNTAHRFVRGDARLDLVVSDPEVVDVMIADHPAPRTIERLRGRDMVRIDGGTQALRRTINARLAIHADGPTTVSVPRPFGALVLKAAAYLADARDRDRHLQDAVVLLACVDDPFDEREQMGGSDRSRLAALARVLQPTHVAWQQLSAADRVDGQAALRLLCEPR